MSALPPHSPAGLICRRYRAIHRRAGNDRPGVEVRRENEPRTAARGADARRRLARARRRTRGRARSAASLAATPARVQSSRRARAVPRAARHSGVDALAPYTAAGGSASRPPAGQRQRSVRDAAEDGCSRIDARARGRRQHDGCDARRLRASAARRRRGGGASADRGKDGEPSAVGRIPQAGDQSRAATAAPTSAATADRSRSPSNRSQSGCAAWRR